MIQFNLISYHVYSLVFFSFLLITAYSQTGVYSPLVTFCGRNYTNTVVCVNHYAAVLPYPFSRATPTSDENLTTLLTQHGEDTFSGTSVPADPSFAQTQNASFIVFDKQRGLQVLGLNPTYEYMYAVDLSGHEAPVYVPSLNALIFSEFAPGVIPQLIIDLNQQPPTLSNYTTNPPVYGVNGGRYFNGSVYWAAGGGVTFGNGTMQTPGIFRVNVTDNSSTTLLNNYFGARFNGPDDLIVDSQGGIYFTDPWGYDAYLGLTAQPVLPPATYYFNASSSATQIVEDSISFPNGIGLSPDEKTLYLTSTAGLGIIADPDTQTLKVSYNNAAPRTVYAFDVENTPNGGKYLSGKRAIYLAQSYVPDGFHVAQNGYLVTAAGFGVDVLDAYGTLLVHVQTNFTVNNCAFAGPERDQLWLVGSGGVAVVKWGLVGMDVE